MVSNLVPISTLSHHGFTINGTTRFIHILCILNSIPFAHYVVLQISLIIINANNSFDLLVLFDQLVTLSVSTTLLCLSD